MIRSGAHSERTSTTTLERGLYVFRYKHAPQSAQPPLVYLRASYGSENAVKFIAVPGLSATTLTQPGTALVISVDATAGIQITIQAVGNGAPEADVSLEPIGQTQRVAPPTSDRFATPVNLAASSAPQVIGHVALRGDVAVTGGQWIAGPDSPAPIEGVGVAWPAGNDLGLEYQVFSQGTTTWSEWIGCGRYAGSRGQSRALVGVRFRLAEGRSHHRLRGAALFLGSSIVERSGLTIELRSAAGFDPLVGLFLDIAEVAEAPAPSVAPVTDIAKPQAPTAGRVRVFRAGGEQKR